MITKQDNYLYDVQKSPYQCKYSIRFEKKKKYIKYI